MRLINFLKKIIGRGQSSTPLIVVDPNSLSIPGALGYTDEKFAMLATELASFIVPADRVNSFQTYLLSPLFPKFGLDLTNPSHLVLLGYAYCAAIMIQRNAHMQDAVDSVLKTFYPEAVSREKTLN